jgi:acyl-CoA thioester hydrolase
MSAPAPARLRDMAARLDSVSYPFTRRHPLRYGDMDSYRHLNNVATARLLEDGRAQVNMEIFGVEALTNPPPDMQLLFGQISIEYVRQAYFPGDVDVATGIIAIGTTSFAYAQAAFQNGACFALSQSVMVIASRDRPRPITEAERTAMQPFLMRA